MLNTEPEIKITQFQFHYDNLEISLAFKLTTRSLGRFLVDYELYNLARDYLIDLSIPLPENALELTLRYALSRIVLTQTVRQKVGSLKPLLNRPVVQIGVGDGSRGQSAVNDILRLLMTDFNILPPLCAIS